MSVAAEPSKISGQAAEQKACRAHDEQEIVG
jgi:hypothetical protein